MFLRRLELRRTGGLLSLSVKLDGSTGESFCISGTEGGGFSAMFIFL